MCVHHIGNASGPECKLITNTLCSNVSEKASELLGSHGECLKPRKTCALVGSSQHLLNATWGEFIDSHEAVIRLNGAPSGASMPLVAQHVGHRTDVRFVNMYGHMPREELRQPMCTFLHEPAVGCGRLCWRSPGSCARGCQPQGLTCRAQGMKEANPNWGRNTVFLDHVHGGIAEQVHGHPTAGFKALAFALHTCETISVFGFGPSCDGTVGARYYHEPTVVTKWHHYDGELDLLKQASKEGVMRIIPSRLHSWVLASNMTLYQPECVSKGTQSKPAGRGKAR